VKSEVGRAVKIHPWLTLGFSMGAEELHGKGPAVKVFMHSFPVAGAPVYKNADVYGER